MTDHRRSSYRMAIVVLGAFLLAAPRSGQATSTSTSIGSDAVTQHHAYILSLSQRKNPWTVQELPLTPGGNMRVLGGPLTELCDHGDLALRHLTSLAISPSGSLYVSGFFGPQCDAGVEAFAPGASGNVRPILRIAGKATRLGLPISMAFDHDGRLYVSQGRLDYARSRRGQVDVFAPGAHGNVSPIAILTVPKTQIERTAVFVAVDAKGAIFVAQFDYNAQTEVLKFAPGASGNIAPLDSTVLTTGYEVEEIQAVDDTLYVALGFRQTNDPTVYKLQASDLSITDEILNPAFSFIHAAADREGRVYVQSIDGLTALFVYPPNSNTPKETIPDDIGATACCGGYVVIGP